MERIDFRGVEYEMSRDLTINIMRYILNEFDGRVRDEIIISSAIYEFSVHYSLNWVYDPL